MVGAIGRHENQLVISTSQLATGQNEIESKEQDFGTAGRKNRKPGSVIKICLLSSSKPDEGVTYPVIARTPPMFLAAPAGPG